MRARVSAHLVFASLLLTASASTSASDLKLPQGPETYTLHPFESTGLRWHYFGEYAFHSSYGSGGTKLHLFPNARFVISQTCDVCADKLVAAGTYEVQDDRLSLRFSEVRPGKATLEKQFLGLQVFWGDIQKKGYVTGFEVFIFTPTEFAKLQKSPKDVDYMQRQSEYNDWEKILNDYLARKDDPSP